MTNKYSRIIKNVIIRTDECITKNWHLIPFSNVLDRSDFEITNAQLANQKTLITLFYQTTFDDNVQINHQQLVKGLTKIISKIESELFLLLHFRVKPTIIFREDTLTKDHDVLDKIMHKIKVD